MILAYLVRRVAYGIVTVLGVLLLLFVLFFLVTNPDDIARRALGEKAPPEAIAQWKVNHGYAKPRFWNPDAPADTMLLLGVSGAITALGDTLFPAASLAEGKAQTFSDSAHVFLRLRLWHPVLALATGALILAAALHAVRRRGTPPVRQAAIAVVGLFTLNLAVGLLNMSWLAPIPLQLVHLLLADLVWIALVVLAAATLAARPLAR